MADGVELFPVSSDVILRHERVLIKQILHIFPEEELTQGPLDECPRKIVEVPNYTGSDKVRDGSTPAYRMSQTDPLGERKITVTGELLGGREHLCSLFKLGELPDSLVLVSHLITALSYDGNQEAFLAEFDQLLPMSVPAEVKDLFIEKDFIAQTNEDLKYITFKSAFVQFGAALVASGVRVFDDYWETIARRQGLTAHHRVFKLSERLMTKLMLLKPSFFSSSSQKSSNLLMEESPSFESPWSTVTEQVSLDVRQQWGREFSYGEHISSVVPGQSIHGSLDLSAQCKIPKYHSKNSFQQAVQMKALDSPIGSEIHVAATKAPVLKEDQISATPQPASKPSKRMLNSILDTGVSTKVKKTEETEEKVGHSAGGSTDETLNVNGWKFDSLPLRRDGAGEAQRSIKGLPFYNQDKLVARVKKLTPNEVRNTEHMHDSVYLNVGLQNVRNIRSQKWSKYWQYKSGVPVGLLSSEIGYFKDRYLNEVLQTTSSVTTYIPETNVDEIDLTTREANANYIGHSNIHGFKPPYM